MSSLTLTRHFSTCHGLLMAKYLVTTHKFLAGSGKRIKDNIEIELKKKK